MKDVKKNLPIALKMIFVLLMVLLIIFSFYSSLELIDHHCTGEDCPICHFIFLCRAAFRVLFFGVFFVFGVTFLTLIKTVFVRTAALFATATPVCLGVKLNN